MLSNIYKMAHVLSSITSSTRFDMASIVRGQLGLPMEKVDDAKKECRAPGSPTKKGVISSEEREKIKALQFDHPKLPAGRVGRGERDVHGMTRDSQYRQNMAERRAGVKNKDVKKLFEPLPEFKPKKAAAPVAKEQDNAASASNEANNSGTTIAAPVNGIL